MLARIAIANELLSTYIQVLLSASNAFAEWRVPADLES